MSASQITIESGLPDLLRRQAGEILLGAFGDKFRAIARLAAEGPAIIDEAIDPQMAIVALGDRQLLGIAGIRIGKQGFCQFRLAPIVRRLGGLQGFLGYFLLRNLIHQPDPGQLVLECIAVSESARGQGIGQQLIDAVCQRAKRERLNSVCLDVLDANRRAYELYERVGFIPVKTRHYPFLRRWLGASAVITMVKPIV